MTNLQALAIIIATKVSQIQCSKEIVLISADGLYYYKNGDGSTYHDDGRGRATYTAPDGRVYDKSTPSQDTRSTETNTSTEYDASEGPDDGYGGASSSSATDYGRSEREASPSPDFDYHYDTSEGPGCSYGSDESSDAADSDRSNRSASPYLDYHFDSRTEGAAEDAEEDASEGGDEGDEWS